MEPQYFLITLSLCLLCEKSHWDLFTYIYLSSRKFISRKLSLQKKKILRNSRYYDFGKSEWYYCLFSFPVLHYSCNFFWVPNSRVFDSSQTELHISVVSYRLFPSRGHVGHALITHTFLLEKGVILLYTLKESVPVIILVVLVVYVAIKVALPIGHWRLGIGYLGIQNNAMICWRYHHKIDSHQCAVTNAQNNLYWIIYII